MIETTTDISIVVPVYNSSKSLLVLVSKISDAMNSLNTSFELLLVDDCSTDSSWQTIDAICKSNPGIKGLRLAKNKGQWVSTLAGIGKSTGKFIVTIDDDLEYEPADIIDLYNTIKGGDYYLVCGLAKDKYILQGKGKFSLWRKRMLIKLWDTAVTDSFKIFSRAVVFRDGVFLPGILIDAYIEHNLDKRFWAYCQVTFRKRHEGRSNYSLISKFKLFFIYSVHYLKNPAKMIFAWFIISNLAIAGIGILGAISTTHSIILAFLVLPVLVSSYVVLCLWVRFAADYQIIDTKNFHQS